MSADHCAAFGEALRERGLCHTRQDSVDLICNMFQFKTLWQCSLLVILLATIMLFSKHHCQKVFKMKHISYKICELLSAWICAGDGYAIRAKFSGD